MMAIHGSDVIDVAVRIECQVAERRAIDASSRAVLLESVRVPRSRTARRRLRETSRRVGDREIDDGRRWRAAARRAWSLVR